ncbi:hypothetical protein CY35_13G045900 [Sphagnum magellanicum]|jgi:pterin-4a-carbinolamine dehydratase|nr:hypothetical protein CY35_13G045900 [Sphagnum magellanicum]
MALALTPLAIGPLSSLSAFARTYSASSCYRSSSASYVFLQRSKNSRILRVSRVGRTPPGQTLVVRTSGNLGTRDTFPEEHNSMIPSSSQSRLAEKSCKPLPTGTPALSKDEAEALLGEVVGWRISSAHDAGLKLQYDWNLKNFKAGLELFSRIAAVAEAEKHHPDLHLENYKKVRAEIWTHTVGGLSENDFILAAKINQIDTRDLVSKKKS